MRLDQLPAKDRKAVAAGRVTVPKQRLSRPTTPPARVGRGSRWRCHTCGELFTVWAKAQRHADGHGGARLELVLG
jgi:transposase-like protein